MQELVSCDRSTSIIESSGQALINSPICFTTPRVINELIVIPLVERRFPLRFRPCGTSASSNPASNLLILSGLLFQQPAVPVLQLYRTSHIALFAACRYVNDANRQLTGR